MEIDLDLNNYSFNDLLNLFHLSYDFGQNELKQAYKIVLKTHPDKSGLDKEYFLFFSKAFKLLKSVYDYNTKSKTCPIRRSVYIANNETNKDSIIEKKIETFTKDKNFHKKFNELFERVKLEDDEQDSGYGDWFKSNKDLNDIKTNKVNMNLEFNKHKSQIRSIIKHKDIEDVHIQKGSSLLREKPENYSSSIFSRLNYNDLKQTYTETVVPVTEEDYYSREKFNTVEQMQIHRKQTESIPDQHITKKRLMEKYKKEKQEDVQRAYKMMKQMDDIKKSHNTWMSNFKQITNM